MLKSIREHQENRFVQHVRSLMLLTRRRLALSSQAEEIQGTCHLWVEAHAMFVAKESTRASSSGLAEVVVLGKSAQAGFVERVDFGSEEGARHSLRRASIWTNNCCDSVASSAGTCCWSALSRNMAFLTMPCRWLHGDTSVFGRKHPKRQDINTNCRVGSFCLDEIFGLGKAMFPDHHHHCRHRLMPSCLVQIFGAWKTDASSVFRVFATFGDCIDCLMRPWGNQNSTAIVTFGDLILCVVSEV